MTICINASAENIYNKNLAETKDTHILRPNMLNKYVGKEIELNLVEEKK